MLDKELATKIEEEKRHGNEAIIKRIEDLEKLVRALLSTYHGNSLQLLKLFQQPFQIRPLDCNIFTFAHDLTAIN